MKGFIIILLGQIVSVVGSGMTRFALGVWILEETGSPTQYGLFVFMFMFAGILVSLVSGPLIDRWNRRRILIGSDTIAWMSTLVLILLFFFGDLKFWHIFLMVAVNSAASTFQTPTFQACIPLLVPKKRLAQAAGMGQLVRGLDFIIAPAIAGVLIFPIGLGGIMLIDSVTFLIGISMVLLVFIPQPQETSDTVAARGTFWQEFTFGLRYIGGRAGFVYLIVYGTLIYLFMGVALALFNPLVLSFTDATILGFVFSSLGFGYLAGGGLLSFWGGSQRRMLSVLGSGFVLGISFLLVGMRPNALQVGIGMFFLGASFMFLGGLSRVIFQVKADPNVLGRIFSVRILLGSLATAAMVLGAPLLATNIFEPLLAVDGAWANSIGALIGVGDGRGLGFTFIITGILILLCTLIFLIIPSARLLEDSLPDYEISS